MSLYMGETGDVTAQLDARYLTSHGLTPSTTVQSANFTAVAGTLHPINATGSLIVTLPTAPADGVQIGLKAVAPNPIGGTVTINAGGSDVFNKTGGSTSISLAQYNQGLIIQYQHSTGIWYVTDDSLSLSALNTANALLYAPLAEPVALGIGNLLALAPFFGTDATTVRPTGFAGGLWSRATDPTTMAADGDLGAGW